ncbi:hypothetical protein [Cribrihabitans pelagius]|uniref:hypothetical protein n=1 Tax=Cribrihabitans pelagius TaxID=1765746 RepID=UPI003B58E721
MNLDQKSFSKWMVILSAAAPAVSIVKFVLEYLQVQNKKPGREATLPGTLIQ